MSLTLTQVAEALGYSKGRISQLVGERRLEGAYTGEGRERRFDLRKTAELLNLRLDAGQQTGNGVRHLETRAKLSDGPAPIDVALSDSDSDARRLARARADAAEVEARRKRREEQLAVGRYVLADEAARAAQVAVAETLAVAERIMIAEAKRLAVEFGANPREVAAEVRRRWRQARAVQSQAMAARAEAAQPTEAEAAEMAEA